MEFINHNFFLLEPAHRWYRIPSWSRRWTFSLSNSSISKEQQTDQPTDTQFPITRCYVEYFDDLAGVKVIATSSADARVVRDLHVHVREAKKEKKEGILATFSTAQTMAFFFLHVTLHNSFFFMHEIFDGLNFCVHGFRDPTPGDDRLEDGSLFGARIR